MDTPVCPFCNAKQKDKPLGNWKYVNNTDVYRYKCKCGKMFNFYKGQNKSWTIPKPQ